MKVMGMVSSYILGMYFIDRKKYALEAYHQLATDYHLTAQMKWSRVVSIHGGAGNNHAIDTG